MRVEIGEKATSDLRKIAAYFEDESASGAKMRDKFLASFDEACDLLSNSPRIGRRESFAVPANHAQREVRRFPVSRFPNYLIIYTLTEDTVLVTRVLHGARHTALRVTELP